MTGPSAQGGFCHKIGDALYDLVDHDQPLREGDDCEETVMYTIAKRTERYVYVHEFCDRPWRIHPGRLVRFSIDELERKGHGWNRTHRMGVHTRPMPHWPLLVLSCEPGNRLEPADCGRQKHRAARRNGEVSTDALPPVQYLIMEVLAARARLGEAYWTFPKRFTRDLEALSKLGLLWFKSGVAPKTYMAFLTDAGWAAAMSERYTSPNEDEVQLDGAEVAAWLEGAQERLNDELHPDSRAEIEARIEAAGERRRAIRKAEG